MVVLRKRSKVRIDILAKTFIMTLTIRPKLLIIKKNFKNFIRARFQAFFCKEMSNCVSDDGVLQR